MKMTKALVMRTKKMNVLGVMRLCNKETMKIQLRYVKMMWNQ